jgi:hypothetical protein
VLSESTQLSLVKFFTSIRASLELLRNFSSEQIRLHFSAIFSIYLGVPLFLSLVVSARSIKFLNPAQICSQEALKKSGSVFLKKSENHSCPRSKALCAAGERTKSVAAEIISSPHNLSQSPGHNMAPPISHPIRFMKVSVYFVSQPITPNIKSIAPAISKVGSLIISAYLHSFTIVKIESELSLALSIAACVCGDSAAVVSCIHISLKKSQYFNSKSVSFS